MRDRTVLVVAHKPKTIRHAHRILVVDGGRIVEQGAHEELLAQPSLYARLWNLQQQAGGWTLRRNDPPA